VQPVLAPPGLSGPRRIAAAAVAVAAAVVLLVVSSRPDARAPVARHAAPPTVRHTASPAARQAEPPPVARLGGKALQSARCAQWRGAPARQRDAVVATLAAVVGGSTPYGPASTLPASVAHDLFDRTCARRYARGFLLYELYTRAAAFSKTPQRRL